MKKILYPFICILFIIHSNSFGQSSKTYFDKTGKAVNSQELAYYHRSSTDTAGFYRSFYTSSNSVYFEGRISKASSSNESANTYSGTCKWFYKNGNVKAIRSFNEEGKEEGMSKYFYESGKPSKEIEFVKGKVKNNSYTEYNEDGQANWIMEDDFTNNENDWDVYTSEIGSSIIKDGNFELTSFTKDGTSRYINLPMKSQNFTLEAILHPASAKNTGKYGVIFGFKDWQNYNYFLISDTKYYVGAVFEGIHVAHIDGMFASNINRGDKNIVKIISFGEKCVYSINGEIQYSHTPPKLFGNNFGFAVSGKSSMLIDKLIFKKMDVSSSDVTISGNDVNVKSTGSGIIVNTAGYIMTNHHVIDNSSKVQVEMIYEGNKKTFNAKIIQSDKDNDLAIIKIEDDNYKPISELRYAFKENGGIDVGSAVFTIGFPYALSGMGKEAKFTDGKISAKTGYNSAINSFQTSIPVQPGNSGGPVFNDKGQLIGLINASIQNSDNVSYAIKLTYLNNLLDLLNEKVIIPTDNQIAQLPIEEKIKTLTNYVVLIKVK